MGALECLPVLFSRQTQGGQRAARAHALASGPTFSGCGGHTYAALHPSRSEAAGLRARLAPSGCRPWLTAAQRKAVAFCRWIFVYTSQKRLRPAGARYHCRFFGVWYVVCSFGARGFRRRPWKAVDGLRSEWTPAFQFRVVPSASRTGNCVPTALLGETEGRVSRSGRNLAVQRDWPWACVEPAPGVLSSLQERRRPSGSAVQPRVAGQRRGQLSSPPVFLALGGRLCAVVASTAPRLWCLVWTGPVPPAQRCGGERSRLGPARNFGDWASGPGKPWRRGPRTAFGPVLGVRGERTSLGHCEPCERIGRCGSLPEGRGCL